jgi:hypothetical protein
MSARQLFRVVELSECVKVQTNIQEANLPALRSGFAGYPLNPRWNASKTIAWKIGQQWRLALKDRKMRVRASDSMLVPANSDREAASEDPDSCSSKERRNVLAWGSAIAYDYPLNERLPTQRDRDATATATIP